MASPLIRDLLGQLPSRIRDNVEGYVDAVAASVPEIEKESRLQLGDKLETFLYLVAIRKIWAAVNGQFWIMHDSVELARKAVKKDEDDKAILAGFQIGRDQITRNSEAFIEGENLRSQMEALLRELDIEALIVEPLRLSDIAKAVVHSDGLTENPRQS